MSWLLKAKPKTTTTTKNAILDDETSKLKASVTAAATRANQRAETMGVAAYLKPSETTAPTGEAKSNGEPSWRTASGVPLLLVVVNGGPGTITTAHQAAMNGVPVYVVKGSGRAADFLATIQEVIVETPTNEEPEVEKVFERWEKNGSGPLWSAADLEAVKRRVRDIIRRAQITIYDLQIDDFDQITLVLSRMRGGPRRSAKASLLRDLDYVVQRAGSVFGRVELALPGYSHAKGHSDLAAAAAILAAQRENNKDKENNNSGSGDELVSPLPSFPKPTDAFERRKPTKLEPLPPPPALGDVTKLISSPKMNVAEFFRPPWGLDEQHLCAVFLAKWKLHPPNFIVSVAGGNSGLESCGRWMDGVVNACHEANGWIFTSGTSKTAAAVVGHVNRNLSVPMIGFIPMGRVKGRQRLATLGKGGGVLQVWEEKWRETEESTSLRGLAELEMEPHHTHFVIVGEAEDGQTMDVMSTMAKEKLDHSGDPAHQLRFRVLQYWRERDVAVGTVIISGGYKTISTALSAVRSGSPLLVGTGSGRAADALEKLHVLHRGLIENHKRLDHSVWFDQAKPMMMEAFPELRTSPSSAIVDLLEDALEVVQDGNIFFVNIHSPSATQDMKQAVLRMVIEKGTTGVVDQNGESSLMFAARSNDMEMARKMLEQGDILTTPDRLSFVLALKHNNEQVAELILECVTDRALLPGKSPNFHDVFTAREEEEGATPLMLAARSNMTSLMQKMQDVYTMAARSGRGMDFKFEIDARCDNGESALHFAVRGGSVEAAQWLLSRGANALLPPPRRKLGHFDFWRGNKVAPTSPKSPKSSRRFSFTNGPKRIKPDPNNDYFSPYHLSLLLWRLQKNVLHEEQQTFYRFQSQQISNQEQEDSMMPGSMSFSTRRDVHLYSSRCENAARCVDRAQSLVDTFISPTASVPGETAASFSLTDNSSNKTPSYSSSPSSTSIHFHRNFFALKTFSRWAGLYSVFLILVCLTAAGVNSDLDDDTYLLYDALRGGIVQTPIPNDPLKKTFNDIVDAGDFWGWFKGPLFDAISPSSPVINEPVGFIRLRQVRVGKETCGAVDPGTCYPPYADQREDKETYGPTPEFQWTHGIDSHEEVAVTHMFPGSGFVVEMDVRDTNATNALLDVLQNNNWIDAATRGLFVDFTLYNEVLEKIVFCHFIVEFYAAGSTAARYRLSHIEWSPSGVSEGGWVLGLKLALIAWNVCLFTNEIVVMRRAFRRYTHVTTFRERARIYLKKGYNAWDFFNVLFFFAIMGVHFAVLYYRFILFDSGLDDDKYYDTLWLSHFVAIRRYLDAFYVLSVFGKTLKYLQLLPRVGPVLQAIISTIANIVILAFLGFFLLFVLVMCLSFRFAFGTQYEFKTIERSWFSTMLMLFGEIKAANLDESVQPFVTKYASIGASGVFLMIFLLFGNLVIMNIVIAVVSQVYQDALREYSQTHWESLINSIEADHFWNMLPIRAETAEETHGWKRLGIVVRSFFSDLPRKPPIRPLDPAQLPSRESLQEAKQPAGVVEKELERLRSQNDDLRKMINSLMASLDGFRRPIPAEDENITSIRGELAPNMKLQRARQQLFSGGSELQQELGGAWATRTTPHLSTIGNTVWAASALSQAAMLRTLGTSSTMLNVDFNVDSGGMLASRPNPVEVDSLTRRLSNGEGSGNLNGGASIGSGGNAHRRPSVSFQRDSK